MIVKQLTLVVADEEVLAGQAHEDEGDPKPDRGPAPRLVSHYRYFERSRDEERRGHEMRYVSSTFIAHNQ